MCAQESKSDNSSSGTSIRSGRSSRMSNPFDLALGASPLDWVEGMGLLVWVSSEYTGISGYRAQVPHTILNHQGQL